MKNFKKFIIPGAITLTILGSTTAFAVGGADNADAATDTTTTPMVEKEAREGFGGRGGKGSDMTTEEKEAMRAEKETKRAERHEAEATMLEDAEKLVPGGADEIEAIQEELSTARESVHEEMDAIREKVESGEITREEMRETLGDKMGRRGKGAKEATDEDSERPANPWDELQTAIEADDKDGVQTALDSILEHMEEHLADMNERLSAIQ